MYAVQNFKDVFLVELYKSYLCEDYTASLAPIYLVGYRVLEHGLVFFRILVFWTGRGLVGHRTIMKFCGQNFSPGGRGV